MTESHEATPLIVNPSFYAELERRGYDMSRFRKNEMLAAAPAPALASAPAAPAGCSPSVGESLVGVTCDLCDKPITAFVDACYWEDFWTFPDECAALLCRRCSFEEIEELPMSETAVPIYVGTQHYIYVSPEVAKAFSNLEDEITSLSSQIADYEETYKQHQANVRRLDVALNGEDAAQAPLLIDVLGQVEELARKCGPLLRTLTAREVECREARAKAIEDIAAERKRQIEQEGWDTIHDNTHDEGELAYAASCYALAAAYPIPEGIREDPNPTVEAAQFIRRWWPWDWCWWKPRDDPRRSLVKAGALIVAEIERIDRAESLATTSEKPNG